MSTAPHYPTHCRHLTERVHTVTARQAEAVMPRHVPGLWDVIDMRLPKRQMAHSDVAAVGTRSQLWLQQVAGPANAQLAAWLTHGFQSDVLPV